MRKLNSFVAVSSLAVAFLLGIIAGVAIDVKERKNTVRMAVQYDSSEVYVAPFVGDTVQWFKVAADGSFKQVETDFGGGGDPSMSPCDPAYNWDKPNCHIRKPDNLRDRYRYHCKLYPCIDPGGGPQSTTGGDFMEAEHQFWQILILDIEGLLHLQQTSFAVPGASGPGGGISPKAIVGTPIHMQVSCPASTNKVTVYDPNGNETTSINAIPQNLIVWDTQLNLTISDNNNLCSNDSANLATTGCNIDPSATGSHTYTASATDAKCSSGNSSTQTVVLP